MPPTPSEAVQEGQMPLFLFLPPPFGKGRGLGGWISQGDTGGGLPNNRLECVVGGVVEWGEIYAEKGFII